MKYRFIAEAQAELDEAAAWDERQSSGLGMIFLRAVQAAIDRICDGAETFAYIDPPFRYCSVRRFPDIVIDKPRSTIEIHAIMPLSRQPGDWRNRSANRAENPDASEQCGTQYSAGRDVARRHRV